MELVSKLQHIIDGWGNYLKQKPKVEKLAKERAEICAKCEHAIEGTYEKLMPDYSITTAYGMKCNVCQCPLSTKLRATEEVCPKGKW